MPNCPIFENYLKVQLPPRRGIIHVMYPITLVPEHWPEHTRNLTNKAKWSLESYQRYDKILDLNSAIDCARHLVTLTLANDTRRPESLHILGQALKLRFEKLRNQNDLTEAIKTLEEVLQSIPKGYSRRGGYTGSLAEIKYCKFTEGQKLEDLEAAIQLARAAVDETLDVDWSLLDHLHRLAEYLGARYDKQRDPKDLDMVFDIYRRSFTISRHTDPLATWTASIKWANCGRMHRPAECLKAYSTAFNTVLPELLWLGNPILVHQQVLRRIDITTETSNAITACIDGSNLRLAIELVEQGLATTLQRLLQLTPSLEHLPQCDADELLQLSAQLYGERSQRSTGDPAQHSFATRRNNLISEIRSRPGFEDFLSPKRFEALRQAAQGGPVIVLSSHETHCDTHRFALKGIVNGRDESRHTEPIRLQAELEGFQPPEEMLEDMLDWIWKKHCVTSFMLNWSVMESLEVTSGGVPLVIYTSTLGILLDGILKKPTGSPIRVGVAGLTHSGPRTKSALPGVAKEVTRIVAAVGENRVETLMGEQATVEAVKKQLQACSWIHLACHAKQDLESPRESCLSLYEGTLSLEAILGMPLPNAEFIYLAACQTAMGDSSLTNESFHLGGGFVAAGFRGAIGTMWSMIDEDGPTVAETVYTHLFAENQQPQVGDAAKALQLAVRKLREAGVAYSRWVPFIHIGI
ncbi:CHAT domain-containing protein [Mycena rosella]|uniref:CHAT domain-containing protein n=1 Tax=Mycena rosella TaxID=1033263 RepID=A0AAD7DJC3_MYCRO|nr:CHAT domain-containing protein [Mycena rosella]